MERRRVDLDGPIYFEEYPGPAGGPTFVCVHGLGGSHLNWRPIGPGLSEWGRVLVPDLAGFGRTPLASRSAAVPANARLLTEFIGSTVGGPAIIVGNSMGGLIALLLALEPASPASGLVLVAPAVPRPTVGLDRVSATFATAVVPRAGELLLRRRARRLGADGLVRETLALVMVDPSRLDPDLRVEMEALAAERLLQPWAPAASVVAVRSLIRILARRQRFWLRLKDVSVPTLVFAGGLDRLVPLSSLRFVAGLRPDWDLVVFDDLGHVPQMEDPARVLAGIHRWLRGPAARVLGSHRAEP